MRTANPRSRTSRTSAIVLSALVAVSVASTAACGGSAGSSPQAQMELKSLRIGVVTDEIGALPVWTGKDNNLFSSKGLSVTVTTFPDDEAVLKALSDGNVDVVYADYARAIEAKSVGDYRISLVAEGYDAGPGSVSLVQTGTTQTSVSQDALRVLKAPGGVLVPTIGQNLDPTIDFGVPALMLANALPGIGVNLVNSSTRTKYLKPGLQSAMADKLRAKSAAAAVMTEPYWTQASSLSANSDLTVLMDLTTGGNEDMPLGGYFAQQDFALKNVNTLKVFVSGLNDAKVASASRAMVTAELERNYVADGHPMSDQVASSVTLGTFPLTVNAKRIQKVLDAMQNLGLAPFFKLDSMLPPDAIR